MYAKSPVSSQPSLSIVAAVAPGLFRYPGTKPVEDSGPAARQLLPTPAGQASISGPVLVDLAINCPVARSTVPDLGLSDRQRKGVPRLEIVNHSLEI